MARPKTIPHKLRSDVIAKSAEGWNAEKIATWLKTDHDINITMRAVQQYLKEIKDERNEIAQRAMAEDVAKSVTYDLSILGDKIFKFNAEVDRLLSEGKSIEAKSVGEILFKFLDRRMKLSGIDNPEKTNNTQLQSKDELLEGLLSKFKK